MPAPASQSKGLSFSQQKRLSGAKLKEFHLVQGGWEYRNREDQTILSPHILVAGSQNVVTNVSGRIGIVKGFTLDGTAGTLIAPILSSFDYFLHNGSEVNARAYLDPNTSLGVLQARCLHGTTPTWTTVLNTLASGTLRFTNFWDFNNELKDLILFVDGSGTIYEWTGAMTTLTSATSNSITNTGNTFAQDNFYNVNFTLGDSTTVYTITNTSGATFRYTYVSGTNPNITAALIPAGMIVYLSAQNFSAVNNGVFTVTGSGANYFEVTNAAGTAEATKSIGTGFADYLAQQIVIGGTTYTYHGGAGTNTITNVTPDPSAIAANSVIIQKPRPFPITGITSLPTGFNPDLISVLKNQVYYGNTKNNSVYVSKTNNYKDVSTSTPRNIGDGALFTLDASPIGFAPQEDQMYIAAGKEFWFLTKFTLSADLSKESLTVERLKTGAQQGAQSQEMISKEKNNVIFISNEPILTSLGRVTNILGTPQLTDLSAPIVNDFNGYDFGDGSVKYHKNFLYVAVPKEGLIRIYNQTDPAHKHFFWEAPVTYPIGRFSVIAGELYGHSYQTNETYKLFTGYNFNGFEIPNLAVFAYNNYGSRATKKGFNEFFIEGYVNPNTTLTLNIRKEIDGCASDSSYQLDGSNTRYVCIGGSTAPLGKESIGINPLGGDYSDASSLPPKFRIFHTFPTDPYFFEAQVSFSNTGIDQQWELICFGPNLNHLTAIPTDLKS